ncbi:MAG: PD-(D/E)XK nuclease family protein [Clostridia bacterium]|nr:PD-(D/E)XK nuclease family protein [Clostridia bacterium]
MLQLVCGRSGSGKTEFIRKKIFDAANSQKDIILIVPEQSSFQNERKILENLGAKKASKINVLSFSRLCDIILEQYGGITKKRIDDGTKTVIMSLALEEVSDQLILYGNRSKKNDLTELMMGAVREYKMCAITPDKILETADRVENERLKEKLRESALVYSTYNAMIDRAYSDPSDDLTRLYETLSEHPYFNGKTVFLDSFNGYSGQEMRVLECIIGQAESVTISVGCERNDGKNTKNSIFAEPDNTYRQLIRTAQNNNIEIATTVWLDEQKRFRAKSLAAIEESIYRYDGDEYFIDDNAVSMYEANDEYDEIEQTARDISQLTLYEGYSYSDIAVICRQPEMYKSIIETEFSKCGISYFMSNPQKLETKPLVKLILSAFDVVHSSFNTESIFTFLKTGLTNLNFSEICRLENYAYMWDIRGKRWKSPFTMNPNGNSDRQDEEELKNIEQLRINAIEPLEKFAAVISKAENGAEISVAVYTLLKDVKADEKIKELVYYFGTINDIKSKEEEARIWDITMDILDKMYTVLKDTYLDSKRYAELLNLMINKNDISDIPQTLDQVTIGTAGNIRVENPRAVFVIGAVENVFPAVPTDSGIFSDSERCELLACELPVYESLYSASLKEKYNAYSAVSSPSEKLFISWYKTNSGGENCEPSSIYREVSKIDKNIKIRHRYALSDSELFYTEAQSFSYCAENFNKQNSRFDTLKKYYEESEKYSSQFNAIQRAYEDKPYIIENKKNAKAVFGENLRFSASQIESYNLCGFAYFCKYGLKANPRKKATMDSGLYGSAVHFVLENILRDKGFETFRNYNQQELSQLVDEYLIKFIDSIGGDKDRTERFLAACESMKKNIVILLKRLIAEFKETEFVPTDFELKIGGENEDIPQYTLELPTGEKVSITGKIDRVDTYVRDGKKYIRIVDYKTGAKSFSLSDILYGLNMQMLLYLAAIEKNGTEHYSENGKYSLMPAGILYMPSTPTSDTGDKNNKDEQLKLIDGQNKKFKMNGLLIEDKDVLCAMEKNLGGLFIPVKITKTGDFDSRIRKNLSSLESFGKIFSYIDKKILSMAESLYKGEIAAVPVKAKNNTDACQYCDYKSVCGFEEGKATRDIQPFNNDDVMEIINSETENECEEAENNE